MKEDKQRRTNLIFASALSLCFLCGCASPGHEESFVKLEALDSERGGDWATSLSSFRGLFREESERLGRRIYVDLPVFVGTNLTRHYWCSSFLEDMDGLEADPLRQRQAFALLILEQGLALIQEEGSTDEIMDAKASKVSMHYRAAVLADKLRLHVLAVQHKTHVEELITQNHILRGALPVCSVEDTARYEAIKIRWSSVEGASLENR